MPATAALLWFFVSMMLVASSRGLIIDRAGWDPDDQLRLVQLRDFLNGQSWFDTTQYRMNPPDGAPMHWSRLIELPLALIVIIASPAVGTARAEMLASIVVPLFCLGAIAFMASSIASRFGGKFANLAAVLITLLAPAILIQTRPMRIDHHGWQAVLAMLGLWTFYWHAHKRAGIVLGLALATWLHISMEGTPLTAAFFLFLGWRWIRGDGEDIRFFWTLIAFAIASLGLFFGTQPTGLLARNYCDTISPMHIAAIIVGTAILLPVIHLRVTKQWWRVAAILLAGAAIAACIMITKPICARGAFAGLHPLVRDYWYINVNEGLPIWRQDREAAWTLIAGPIMGLVALVAIKRRTDDPQWAPLDYFVGFSALLSIFVFRSVTVAAAFAAIPAAIWVAPLIQRWKASEVAMHRMALVVLMIILVIPGSFVGPVMQFVSTKAETVSATQAQAAETGEKCQSIGSVRKLTMLPDSNLLAPFDMGPAILLTTRHRVLASSHHRNTIGMRDQIAIFRSHPEKARLLLQKHGITRIVACMDEAEMSLYKDRDPKGLWAQLADAKAPNWLENEGVYGDGIMVWRIKP